MLHELTIADYAVVERLRVRFHAGLNLLTGETGSGKSIVVDALALLLGGRASSDAIRAGAARARVAGVFEAGDRAWRILTGAGFDSAEREIVIEREVLASGKSRAYLNDRPATAALLRELAPYLGDIHGQHDQQLLFDPAAQLSMLDDFARTRDLRHQARDLFLSWKRVSAEIAGIEASEREKTRLMDLWRFQKREIETAELRPGEDSDLEAERRVQQNAERLAETAHAAFESLYESPESALTIVRVVARRLEDAARFDPTMSSMREALEPALIAIQDAADSLRDYMGDVDANPARLEEIENRLATIDKLKRKYGGTVEEILAFLADASRRIDEAESAGVRIEELRRQHSRLAEQCEAAAARLTERRRDAAGQLAGRVVSELAPLAMERTAFRIEVGPAPWSETGADRVDFLVSLNAGEEPRSLDRVASGGELSRIALALKTCLIGSRGSARAVPRTLVFDEIDTGIGGRAAEGVARRLKALASEHQVLCVTHLAQIACFADHHYRVEKCERNGRMVADIEVLDALKSTEEIGRMLSGRKITPEALRNAAQLIRAARA